MSQPETLGCIWGKLPIFLVAPIKQSEPLMKVLLRDTQTALYFAGPGRWVKQQAEAMDLQTIEHAAQVYEAEELPFVQILTDEGSDVVTPQPVKPAIASDLKA